MKPLREIWQDVLTGLKDTFVPPKGSIAYRLGEAVINLLEGHEALPSEEKIDLWRNMAGIETEAEKTERQAQWVKDTRANLVADKVPAQTLRVFDSLTDAKWPGNALGNIGFWIIYNGAKLGGLAQIIGAEGMYELARQVKPARPDPATAWRMVFTSDIPRNKIVGALQDAGWDMEYINALEKAYRQYTGEGESMALLRRGEINQSGFFERLAKLGFDSQAMVDMLDLKDLIPPPPDLVRMALREAFRDDVAAAWSYDEDFPPAFATWMEKQGYSQQWAKYYWRAHWALPSVSQGFEMRHRDVINEGELNQLLRISDIPRRWRENLTEIAYRPLTRVDVRRMHDMGVLTDQQVKRAYKDLGYNETNAQLMLDFTVAYNDRTGEGEDKEFKDITRSMVIQAYQKGLLTREQAETRLMELEYDTEAIELLLELADWEQEIVDAPDYSKEYARDIKGIVEKAYSEKVLSHGAAVDMLVDVGLPLPEAEYTLTAVDFWWAMDQSAEVLKTIGEAYVKRGINRADALDGLGQFGIPSSMVQQKMTEWDIQRNIRSRRLTEAQYRKALQEGIISRAEYEENMRGLGYTDYDIWVLVSMAVGTESAGYAPESGPVSLSER